MFCGDGNRNVLVWKTAKYHTNGTLTDPANYTNSSSSAGSNQKPGVKCDSSRIVVRFHDTYTLPLALWQSWQSWHGSNRPIHVPGQTSLYGSTGERQALKCCR